MREEAHTDQHGLPIDLPRVSFGFECSCGKWIEGLAESLVGAPWIQGGRVRCDHCGKEHTLPVRPIQSSIL